MSASAPAADPTQTPRTYDQLQTDAQTQAAAEISAQEAPLQGQIAQAQSDKTAATGDIKAEFGSILPYVSDSAQRVEAANSSALNAEQGIFQAAGQRMNQLAQQRSSEAQQLAQQMGGPVATGEFSAATAPYEDAFPAMQAGGMLHALGLSQANTAEAEAFAGQVFPALQTEQQSKSDQFFNDKVTGFQKDIDSLEASKSGLANDKLNTMLQQERQYKLDLSSAALDRLKANRDWSATQHQLKNDDQRLAISKKEFGLSESGVTGTYKGKPTLAAVKLDAQDKLAAARLNLSAAQYQQRISKSVESQAIQKQRLQLQQSKNAMTVIDNAVNPNGGRPVTMTTKSYIPRGSLAELRASSGKMADAHYDTKTHQWYQYQRQTLTPQQWAKQGGYTGATPISNPQRLYDLVTGSVPGLSSNAVVNMIRAKTGLKDWAPGQKSTYTGAELHGKPLSELRGIAEGRGWKPGGKHIDQQGLVDFIMTHNPLG